jgi:hypothetical protein
LELVVVLASLDFETLETLLAMLVSMASTRALRIVFCSAMIVFCSAMIVFCSANERPGSIRSWDVKNQGIETTKKLTSELCLVLLRFLIIIPNVFKNGINASLLACRLALDTIFVTQVLGNITLGKGRWRLVFGVLCMGGRVFDDAKEEEKGIEKEEFNSKKSASTTHLFLVLVSVWCPKR